MTILVAVGSVVIVPLTYAHLPSSWEGNEMMWVHIFVFICSEYTLHRPKGAIQGFPHNHQAEERESTCDQSLVLKLLNDQIGSIATISQSFERSNLRPPPIVIEQFELEATSDLAATAQASSKDLVFKSYDSKSVGSMAAQVPLLLWRNWSINEANSRWSRWCFSWVVGHLLWVFSYVFMCFFGVPVELIYYVKCQMHFKNLAVSLRTSDGKTQYSNSRRTWPRNVHLWA